MSPAGVFDKGITVRDEGNIIGGNAGIGSITQLNFVGPGVVATGVVTEGLGIATITVNSAGIIQEPVDSTPRYIGFTSVRAPGIFTSFDIAPNALVYIPSTSSIGIGPTQPTYPVEIGVSTVRINSDIEIVMEMLDLLVKINF